MRIPLKKKVNFICSGNGGPAGGFGADDEDGGGGGFLAIGTKEGTEGDEGGSEVSGRARGGVVRYW